MTSRIVDTSRLLYCRVVLVVSDAYIRGLRYSSGPGVPFLSVQYQYQYCTCTGMRVSVFSFEFSCARPPAFFSPSPFTTTSSSSSHKINSTRKQLCVALPQPSYPSGNHNNLISYRSRIYGMLFLRYRLSSLGMDNIAMM